jgi:hypothetical protein
MHITEIILSSYLTKAVNQCHVCMIAVIFQQIKPIKNDSHQQSIKMQFKENEKTAFKLSQNECFERQSVNLSFKLIECQNKF